MNEPRIVRCTIEMELVEGEHFNSIGLDPDNEEMEYATEEQALLWARNAFVDMVQDMFAYPDQASIEDYVQTKIVEEVS